MPKQKIDAPTENLGTRKLLGVFSAVPPLCITTMDKEEAQRLQQTKKEKDPKAAKQFAAGHLASHIAAPGTFSRFNGLANGEPYQEQFKYNELFKDKKKEKGFLSSDFPKRDEFSNTMRTEQLREVLRKEQHMISTMMQDADETDEEFKERMEREKARNKTYLYDVVTRQVPTSFKYNRDDRQGKFFYMKERKDGKQSTVKKLNLDSPTWVNLTLGGRLLTVLLDTQGNVVAQQAGVTDTHASKENQ